jgi:hypothetical protein
VLNYKPPERTNLESKGCKSFKRRTGVLKSLEETSQYKISVSSLE